MTFLRALVLLTLACQLFGCRTRNDCGEVRMYDPENDLCVCRPEYTKVGDFCIPNDEVDAGVDGATDATTDVPGTDGMTEMCGTPEACPARDNATRTCDAMTCGFECDTDWGDCDGDPTNGCETDLTSTPANCGTCGNACSPLLCVDSECVDGAVQVCAGQRHACARRASGTVACWGQNSSGQLGDGSFVDSGVAVDVDISDVIDLDCGLFDFNGPVDAVSCAVKLDGTVWCWGYGANGQLGNGSRIDANEPTQVMDVTGATSVSVHFDHVCATTGLGRTWCWGQVLEDGDGLPVVSDPPFMFPTMGTDRAAVGSCFLRRDGGVDCWNDSIERVDKGLSNVQQLAGGWFHHCALLSDQTVWCWGSNGLGMLGTDLPIGMLAEAMRDEPEQVQGTLRATAIAAHGFGTCAISETAEAWCWGLDVRQDLSTGEFVDTRTPYQISGLPPVRDVDFGRSFVCAVLRDGNVGCLGAGPLGNGEVGGNSTSPVLVEGI